jgi:hypothetical protein
MSKFIDRLKQASTGGQPMGFRAVVAPSKPRLLLVAAVAQGDTADLAGFVAGADAGLLAMAKFSAGAKTLRQLSQAVPDIPWGGWLKEAGQEGIELVAAAGGDFIVFPAGTSLAMLGEEKVGKILEVEPSLEPGLLKAVDDLPVDAVLITAEDGPLLTWRHLMLVQRCANLLRKPLLVLVPPEVTAAELGALWEAGVRGVVVKAGVGGRIAEIAKMLEKLPVPRAGNRDKAGPLLPRMGGGTGRTSEEEEEEEEEEE